MGRGSKLTLNLGGKPPGDRGLTSGSGKRRDHQLEAEVAALLGGIGLAEDLPTKVVWNTRLRTTAGRAYVGRAVIQLNPRITSFPGEVGRTLRHELAHLVAHHRAAGKTIQPHGLEWRRACAELGIRGESRCHSLPLPRTRQARPYAYRCPSCGHTLHRARRFKAPAACHACCKAKNGGQYDPRFELESL